MRRHGAATYRHSASDERRTNTMRNRYALLAKLVVLNIALFAMSGVPALKNADGGWKEVLGGIGWFGGVICAFVLIVLATVTLIQGIRRRAHTA
jgi:hypothetical protein